MAGHSARSAFLAELKERHDLSETEFLVDGNKRTALRAVAVFYMLNGYIFEYGDEIRALLHRFATGEVEVDTETAVIYFRACARRN